MMTYEEAIEAIEYRIKELGGIGKHTKQRDAWTAYKDAREVVYQLDVAMGVIRRTILEGGYERYLTE